MNYALVSIASHAFKLDYLIAGRAGVRLIIKQINDWIKDKEKERDIIFKYGRQWGKTNMTEIHLMAAFTEELVKDLSEEEKAKVYEQFNDWLIYYKLRDV
jgi:hypothetical protein